MPDGCAELVGAEHDRHRRLRYRIRSCRDCVCDRAMMAAWVGQPLTDTGWRLRRPGWVLSKISSTPIPPIPPRPPSLNPRPTCSLTLTAHSAGSTGLYRIGRKKRACPKAVCCSPKPTWTSFVVCGPIWRACCAPADRPRDVDAAAVGIRFGAGRSRRRGAAGAARRRKPSGQRDRADRDLYRPTLGQLAPTETVPQRPVRACRSMTAPATTVRCGTTPVNAATPSTSVPRERANDRAHSTPKNTQLTPKSPDIQAFTAIASRSGELRHERTSPQSSAVESMMHA